MKTETNPPNTNFGKLGNVPSSLIRPLQVGQRFSP